MYNCKDFPWVTDAIDRRRGVMPDGRGIPQDAYGRYMHPSGMEMRECHEDTNGEWVPDIAENNQTTS